MAELKNNPFEEEQPKIVHLEKNDSHYEYCRMQMHDIEKVHRRTFICNLALCILVRKHGGGEALKILRRAAGKNFDAAVFRERIAGMEKNGYALEKSDRGCNLAFPVERGGEIFGLSFFQLPCNDRRISNLIIQCALLRNELEST